MAINTSILLAGFACLGFLLSACTTTYRESELADESLEKPIGESPDCSILGNEPGCELESPFDPDDDEL